MLDRELKKGSAELLILSLVEDQPRHGYDIGNLIEQRSKGRLRFNVASLYREFGSREELGVMELFGEMGRMHAERKARPHAHRH